MVPARWTTINIVLSGALMQLVWIIAAPVHRKSIFTARRRRRRQDHRKENEEVGGGTEEGALLLTVNFFFCSSVTGPSCNDDDGGGTCVLELHRTRAEVGPGG